MKQIFAQYMSEKTEGKKDKVKQNGVQDENLTLLHYRGQATVLILLVGSGRMEDRAGHLSAIYILRTGIFRAVCGNK
jgi:hypothetical protein